MDRRSTLLTLLLPALLPACRDTTGPDLACRGLGCAIVDIRISAPTSRLLKDRTLQLTATPLDEIGNVAATPLTWRSSNQAVATVSNAGVVTGVSFGTAEVIVSAANVQRSFAVHVVQRPTLCSQPGTAAPTAITDTTTWRIADGPIQVSESVRITGTLIIEAGTLVCFHAAGSLMLVRDASASLFAQGAVGDTIVFTAVDAADPWRGISAEMPKEIDLRYIRLERATHGISTSYGKLTVADARISNIRGTAISESNTTATIARVVIDSADTGIAMNYGDVNIRQVTVRNGFSAGIDAFRTAFSLHDLTIENIAETGIVLQLQLTLRSASNVVVTKSGTGVIVGTVGLTLTGFTVSNNRGDGIVVTGTGVAIHGCNLVDNGGPGVRYDSSFGSAAPVDATLNWWGDPGGPNAPGGDGVAGPVNFMPALTQPVSGTTTTLARRY